MKKFFTLVAAATLLTMSSLPVAHAVSMQGGENLNINEAQSDDLYLIGGNIVINEDITGDLYVTGGTITVNGNISEDLVVGGGTVTVLGNVAGDVRIVGGELAVYGNVADDLMVFGGKVDLGRDAVVSGSLITASGLLTLEGTVEEDVQGLMGVMILNGKVNGDVSVTVEDSIQVSEEALIGGDLDYSAILEGTVPAGVVQGQVKFNKFETEETVEGLVNLSLIQNLWSYLASLILLTIFVIFMPKVLTRSALLAKEKVVRAFGVGFLTLAIALVGAIALMITIVGIQLGVIIFAALLMLFFLAQLFAAAWMSSYIVDYKKKIKKRKMFLVMALMLLAYHVIGLIPVVGWIVNLVFFIIGTGAWFQLEMEYFQFLKKKKML
jgi:hypothetical protein